MRQPELMRGRSISCAAEEREEDEDEDGDDEEDDEDEDGSCCGDDAVNEVTTFRV